MTAESQTDDFGFSYVSHKNGTTTIFRHGQPVTALRGADALRFAAKVQTLDADAAQQLMARVTGNYKRGNERAAARHPRRQR